MANLKGFDELLEVGTYIRGKCDKYGDPIGYNFRPEHSFYFKERKRTYTELIKGGDDLGESELINLYTLRESAPYLSTSKALRIAGSLYNIEEIHDNGGELILIRARFRSDSNG